MTVKTPAQALALVKRAGLVTLAARVEGVPCFVEAVVGEPVRGSWWGHPQGKLIFALAEGLEDAREVLTLKLLDGKTTFVHRALWPALLAVVLDEGWRSARGQRLSAGARSLWKKVELASRRGEAPEPVKELEASLLVHVASEHTEQGRHEKRLTSWGHWAKAQQVSPGKLSPDAAREKLKRGTATGL
ncbi:MAG: hypothetical protein Q8L48_00725 [Archangium sp.]|nr:hypothetical protein [Archangium sp.]